MLLLNFLPSILIFEYHVGIFESQFYCFHLFFIFIIGFYLWYFVFIIFWWKQNSTTMSYLHFLFWLVIIGFYYTFVLNLGFFSLMLIFIVFCWLYFIDLFHGHFSIFPSPYLVILPLVSYSFMSSLNYVFTTILALSFV